MVTVYADAHAYRAAFSGSDTSHDEFIDSDLAVVSQHINGITGRFFGQDPEAVERSYRVTVANATLYVDDMAEAPESVTVDGVELDPGDYDLLPRNAPLGPEPRPYEAIRLRSGYFVAGSDVVVEATFGWPQVPPAIARATIEITGILRSQSPRATTRYDEGFGAIIGASKQSRDIIERLVMPYKRRRMAVA
jgi:hypothetical protein